MYIYISVPLSSFFSPFLPSPPRSIANRLTVVDNSIFDLSSISDRLSVFPIRLKIESPIIMVIIIIIIIIIVSLPPSDFRIVTVTVVQSRDSLSPPPRSLIIHLEFSGESFVLPLPSSFENIATGRVTGPRRRITISRILATLPPPIPWIFPLCRGSSNVRSFVRSIDRRVRSTDEVSTRGGGGTIRLPREKRVALYTRMDANERASHTRSDRYAVSSFLSSLLFYRSVHTPPIITYIYRSSERGRSSSDTGRGGRARYPPFADGRIPGHRDACTDGAELAAAPSRASERSPPRIASPRIAQAQDASCCSFLPPSSLHFPLPLSLSFSFFRTTLRAVRCIIFNLLSRSFDAWGRGGSGPFGEIWGEEGDRDGEIETRVFLFSALLLDDKR